jgi:hypothetical protein
LGLLSKAITIRRLLMKLLNVDNPELLVKDYSDKIKECRAVLKGRKIILVPPHSKLIVTGCYIPQVQYTSRKDVVQKYCPSCKTWKHIQNFNKQKKSPDGLKDQCRECDNLKRRIRYAKTRAVT